METNNFDLISSLLDFRGPNDFYFVQLIRRPKENPGLKEGKGNRTRCVKSYYISSREQLEAHKEEIIELCRLFNARAYIRMNYCDESRIALQMMKEISDHILSGNFHGVRRAYDSCCGKYSGSDKDRKYWIVDLDGDEVNLIPEITDIIENQCEPFDHKKVVTQIPTKNGAHLLVRPFNVKKFGELTQKISTEDIKKHALTILYIP